MEKQEYATEVPSEMFQRQASTQIRGALVITHFCHITAAFFKKKKKFCPFPIWLTQTCFFSASKSAFYLRTSQLLWLLVQLAQMHDDS